MEEEGAEEVDEEVGVEVAEPEEGEFHGVAVVGGEEDLRYVGGGGEVQGLVVGFEVVVDDFDVGGEEVGGGGGGCGRHVVAEDWEVDCFQGVDPIGVVVPEWPAIGGFFPSCMHDSSNKLIG